MAIILTGLFVWGRDINTNPHLRRRAIMLSSLVFVIGLSAIIGVSAYLGVSSCFAEDPSRLGNGECDGGEYNTEECGWDGGDCIEHNSLKQKYPDCHVYHPSWIGNGHCHKGEYNTEECGWDGGDCVEFNKQSVEDYPDCHGVDQSLIGNGICDGANTEECGWDGGDCFEINKKYPDCPSLLLFVNRIGGGRCDEESNTVECGWDGGDCYPPAEEENQPPPTTAAATTLCIDTKDYLDMYGGTCADYELPGNEAWCGGYGDHGEEGQTPNENCCFCQGKVSMHKK